MIKVLVAALVGTIIGIVVMVAVIAISGTDTSGASTEGLGSLPLSTYSSSATTPTSAPPPSGGSTNGGSTGGGGGGGDAAAGKIVWDDNGCGSCHTLAAAGATGTVGPDLDTELAKDEGSTPLPAFVKESIIDPEKVIASGFSGGIMPTTFSSLSQTDLNNLVALITQGK